MTREEFIILESLLEKLIDILSSNNQYLPLFLVLIGAVSAIIPQSIHLFLQSRKEKKDKIRELLTDTYKFSQLLSDYHKELVKHKVETNYWHRSSIITQERELSDLYYSWSNESIKRSYETELRIRNTYSEFVKTIKGFQIFVGKIDLINPILKDISIYEPRKPKEFSNSTYNSLRDSCDQEIEALKKEYEKYSEFYQEIIFAMENKINLK